MQLSAGALPRDVADSSAREDFRPRLGVTPRASLQSCTRVRCSAAGDVVGAEQSLVILKQTALGGSRSQSSCVDTSVLN